MDPSGIVAAAVADLAERLVGDITLVSVEEVTWPDTALGCPQPDRAYLQVLIPGWRIVLAVDDVFYAYHSGHEGLPFYCENPSPAVGEPPGLRSP